MGYPSHRKMKKTNNKKLKLLEAWKNPFAELTIAEIMHLTGKNSKPWVFNSLKLLTESQLIIQERKGNLNLYHLDLNNPLLIQTLQFLEAESSYNFPHLSLIKETINKLPLSTYCLIIFGSYSNNTQKKASDLDVCFLIESQDAEKKIKPYFNDIKLSSPVNIDEHYITFADFIKMLLRGEENLAKQIFRNHKIFFNPCIYYQLIKEAYKHGFRA